MQNIPGLAVGGFRSLPTVPMIRLAPMSKLNFVAGQNNAGKSNVLRFLHRVLSPAEAENDIEKAGEWEVPLGSGAEHLYKFGWPVTREEFTNQPHISRWGAPGARFVEGVFSLAEDDVVWFEYSSSTLTKLRTWRLDSDFAQRIMQAPNVGVAANDIARNSLGSWSSDTNQNVNSVINQVTPSLSGLPPVRTISAFRQVEKGNETEASSLSGRNLIRQLQTLQNPPLQNHGDKQRFEAVQAFVRNVLDDDSVGLEIPHDLSSILISKRGSTLPLENLGTGVHQVIIIAAAASVLTDSLVCIEEPEIHLHPVLQRKLVRYLAETTSNQYVIATHSAQLLDSELGSVFHVREGDAGSTVTFAGKAKDRAAVCADLGYRPSDLIQSNAVIWVEGPSDRIYLKHWMGKTDAALREGIDYSIMFYGGRLLNHLSPNDEDVDDFISLRSINRRMAILIDSDKSSADSDLNATKRRVVDAFSEDGPGLAWVTDGYTIENYLTVSEVRAAVSAAAPGRDVSELTFDQFENPLSESVSGFKPDKIKVARSYVETDNAALTPALAARVEALVAFVRQASA